MLVFLCFRQREEKGNSKAVHLFAVNTQANTTVATDQFLIFGLLFF